MDRGYTRSTWAGRFMIGQSTVITNQQGGEEYLSISNPFVALHVLQQHRHVDWDALFWLHAVDQITRHIMSFNQ